MPRYGMIIDITRCNGCYNCFLACRDEYCGNDHPPYSASQPDSGHFWMRIAERERGKYPQAVKVAYIPVPCMHCEDAPCVKASRNGEIYRRTDGIIIIDPRKSKGQEQLMASCPYRVMYWNEEKSIPQKCTLCAHLLDAGWKEPRCVEACPTAALRFGDLDDPKSEVARLAASSKAEILHAEYALKTNVSYIGLPKRFIAGSVVLGDKDECAENVEVILEKGTDRKTTKTNNYGDFEFDGLPSDQDYSLTFKYADYGIEIMKANTKIDLYLGDIILNKRT